MTLPFGFVYFYRNDIVCQNVDKQLVSVLDIVCSSAIHCAFFREITAYKFAYYKQMLEIPIAGGAKCCRSSQLQLCLKIGNRKSKMFTWIQSKN